MNIPNPIDVAKATVNVIVGPQIEIARRAIHVTKRTADTTVHALDAMPAAVASFVGLPMHMLTTAMNIGFWVMGHLKLIFFAIIAVILVVLASFLRTAGKAAHQRVRDTVGGKAPVRSDREQRRIWGKDWQRPGAGRPQAHPQGVVNADGTICVRGELREAKLVAKRAGVPGEPVGRGPCRSHNGCKLFQVV